MSFINLFEMCIESNKKLVSVLVHRLQSNGNLVHGITMSIFINVKFNIIYIYRNNRLYIYIRESKREKWNYYRFPSDDIFILYILNRSEQDRIKQKINIHR